MNDGWRSRWSLTQDDDLFGLDFTRRREETTGPDQGELRHRSQLDQPAGEVRRVEVAVTEVDGRPVVAEAVLHVTGRRVRLVAAEADGPERWLLHDESVVVLPDADDADRLPWAGTRVALRSNPLP